MKYDQEARSLQQICEEESAINGFSIYLLGNTYCKLSLGADKPIECGYCSQYKDKNDLYICNNASYNLLDLLENYKK
jgi:hypothetical protein